MPAEVDECDPDVGPMFPLLVGKRKIFELAEKSVVGHCVPLFRIVNRAIRN